MKDLRDYITESNQELFTKEYLFETFDQINEKLITIGGKPYPNFGHVVIMAGGAGSGKGFVQSMLLGVEGKTFDVDALKLLAMQSKKLNDIIFKKHGVHLKDLDLKNPDHVGDLHMYVGKELNMPNRQQNALATSIFSADPTRKPNIIFDVTLKDEKKLRQISEYCTELGYPKENIHIVWVVNDITVAMEQNATRDRVVPENILISTHKGVASNMSDIFTGSLDVSKYMDGDIWLAFNQKKVDSLVTFSGVDNKRNSQTPKGRDTTESNFTIDDANITRVKTAGSRIDKSKMQFHVIKKIMDYIPKDVKNLKFR